MQHRLKPTRYAELFAEKYPRLLAEVAECFAEGERLNAVIRQQLGKVNDDLA